MDPEDLIRAAWNRDVQWMQSLLNDGSCDINITDKYGRTPLHYAAGHGHKPCVKLLIQHGANANIKDCLAGWTPLHYAALCGHTPCVQLLLQYGADANIQDEWGKTPLHWAILVGHAPCVQLLLQHGADANIQDEGGKTASMLAENKGHCALAALLSRFENPAIKGYIQTRTLQHVADMLNHEECSVLNIVNLNANDEDEFQRQKVEGLRSWTSMNEIKDIGQLIAGLQSANLQRLSDAAKERYADVVQEISNMNDGEFAVLCRGLDTAKYKYTNTQRPTASDTQSPSLSPDHKYDAFINSSEVDRETVKPILQQLKTHGINYWCEEENSEPGRFVIECAIEAIDASKHSIVFLTRAYINDRMCHLLQYHALESNQKSAIPVLMDISREEIPKALRLPRSLSVTDEQLIPKLLKAIKGKEGAPTNGELLRENEILREKVRIGAEQMEALQGEIRIGAEQMEILREENRKLTAKLRSMVHH